MWADAILSLLVFLSILLLFYGPWQETCTDIARQAIFIRRDRLFDLALEGKLDFDSVEYRSIRAQIESIIRYAHILTWPQYVISRLFAPKITIAASGSLPLSDAIALIEDESVRSEVSKIIAQMSAHLLLMMALKSIAFAPVTLVLMFTTVLRRSALKLFEGLRFIEAVTVNIAYNASVADKEASSHSPLPSGLC